MSGRVISTCPRLNRSRTCWLSCPVTLRMPSACTSTALLSGPPCRARSTRTSNDSAFAFSARVQLAHAPAFDTADFKVEIAFEGVVDVDQRLEVRPGQFSPHCRENFLIRKNLRQPHAVAQLLLAPALAKVSRQLPSQFCHHLFAVFAPLTLQKLGADAAPDMPVKLGQFGIDRKGHPLAGRMNQLAYLGQQGTGQRGGRRGHGCLFACRRLIWSQLARDIKKRCWRLLA